MPFNLAVFQLKKIFMKKLLLLCLITATATSVNAQKRSPIRFGVKAGANISHGAYSTDDYNGLKNKFGFGFHAGGLMEISGPAGSKLKGQVEALYNLHGFKNDYNLAIGTASNSTMLHQISVPLMLRYFIIPRFSVNLGPSVNFNLAATRKWENEVGGLITKGETNLKDTDALQTIQIGALAGATYYIHKGFFVDARYNYYFGSVLQSNMPTLRLSAIQVGLGYKF
jgi:opacity protein-like surface antigen